MRLHQKGYMKGVWAYLEEQVENRQGCRTCHYSCAGKSSQSGSGKVWDCTQYMSSAPWCVCITAQFWNTWSLSFPVIICTFNKQTNVASYATCSRQSLLEHPKCTCKIQNVILEKQMQQIFYAFSLTNAYLPAPTCFVVSKGALTDSWKEICSMAAP